MTKLVARLIILNGLVWAVAIVGISFLLHGSPRPGFVNGILLVVFVGTNGMLYALLKKSETAEEDEKKTTPKEQSGTPAQP